jgi:hypothetical protein
MKVAFIVLMLAGSVSAFAEEVQEQDCAATQDTDSRAPTKGDAEGEQGRDASEAVSA